MTAPSCADSAANQVRRPLPADQEVADYAEGPDGRRTHLLWAPAKPRLAEALAGTPVILIHGPRQCGKTTRRQMSGKISNDAISVRP